MLRKLHKMWLEFKFRKMDENVCCCGNTMGEQCSYFGQCRSQKEYTITMHLRCKGEKK